MIVTGFKRTNYDFEDQKTKKQVNCSGYTIYLLEEFETEFGCSTKSKNIFVTDEKLKRFGYSPNLGDNIAVLYNEYGKVAQIEQIANAI